jgi:hypothetical protein
MFLENKSRPDRTSTITDSLLREKIEKLKIDLYHHRFQQENKAASWVGAVTSVESRRKMVRRGVKTARTSGRRRPWPAAGTSASRRPDAGMADGRLSSRKKVRRSG